MTEYANVWPENGLFAFSGVDGETCHAEPFVASGTRDGIGWDFWFEPRVVFRVCDGDHHLMAADADDAFWFSDCWRGAIRDLEGHVRGAFLDRTSMAVELQSGAAALTLEPSLSGREVGNGVVFDLEGCWVALAVAEPGRYGIAASYAQEDEAVARAQQACTADLDAVMADRLAFYEALDVPEAIMGEVRRTYYKAASVQKVNMESAQLDIPCRWCTPDRMPHRHMWLWDTAFNALGLQHLRPDLGESAIVALLAKQREDGKLLLASQPGVPDREEPDTQPPVVAWSVWRQIQETGRMEFAERAYPSLVRYVAWVEKNRKKENGLYGWDVHTTADKIKGARGGESGMDNSPRFDEITAMTAVDLSCYMASEYRALERMATSLWKSDDALEWRQRRERIVALVNEDLWDDEDRFYYDLNQDGDFIPVKTPAGLVPLFAGVPDRDRAEALRLHLIDTHEFWTHVPVASVACNEDTYSKDMWRGPMWPNMNLLLYYGLDEYGFIEEARALARNTMKEIVRCFVRHGCLYEYYDAEGKQIPFELPRKGAPGAAGGTGFGVVEDLNWTAAVFIHLAKSLS